MFRDVPSGQEHSLRTFRDVPSGQARWWRRRRFKQSKTVGPKSPEDWCSKYTGGVLHEVSCSNRKLMRMMIAEQNWRKASFSFIHDHGFVQKWNLAFHFFSFSFRWGFFDVFSFWNRRSSMRLLYKISFFIILVKNVDHPHIVFFSASDTHRCALYQGHGTSTAQGHEKRVCKKNHQKKKHLMVSH